MSGIIERCGRHYYCTIPPHADDIPCQSAEMLRKALGDLVSLKDGPRDDLYREQKEAAWERARVLLRASERPCERCVIVPTPDGHCICRGERG